MSRPFRLLLAAALFVLPCAASLAAADPAGTVACSVANAGFGTAELVCPIAPAGQTQALHLHVPFEGVHDDSAAGLAAHLDGQALACAPGSRTRLQGDGEGDTLSCRMAVPPATAARELRLQLVWSHAEPAPYTLRRE